jgi:hypothetical protein
MISASQAYIRTLNGKIEETEKSIEGARQPWIEANYIPLELELILLKNGYKIIDEVAFGEHNSVIKSKKISWEHACPNPIDKVSTQDLNNEIDATLEAVSEKVQKYKNRQANYWQ